MINPHKIIIQLCHSPCLFIAFWHLSAHVLVLWVSFSFFWFSLTPLISIISSSICFQQKLLTQWILLAKYDMWKLCLQFFTFIQHYVKYVVCLRPKALPKVKETVIWPCYTWCGKKRAEWLAVILVWVSQVEEETLFTFLRSHLCKSVNRGLKTDWQGRGVTRGVTAGVTSIFKSLWLVHIMFALLT